MMGGKAGRYVAIAVAAGALVAGGAATGRDPEFMNRAREDVGNFFGTDDKSINIDFESTDDTPAGPVQQ